jgi:hypothetical protein
MTTRGRQPYRRSHEGVELFISTNTLGTDVDLVLRDSGILLSLALQHGAGAQTIRRAPVLNADSAASGSIRALLDKIEEREQ